MESTFQLRERGANQLVKSGYVYLLDIERTPLPHISCSGLPCRLHAENNSKITQTVGIAVLLLPPLGVVKLCKFSESRQGIRGEPGFTGFNQCAGISKTWATATHKRIISCTHVLGSFKIHQRHEMHGSPHGSANLDWDTPSNSELQFMVQSSGGIPCP